MHNFKQGDQFDRLFLLSDNNLTYKYLNAFHIHSSSTNTYLVENMIIFIRINYQNL
jgi:hypothetical protein